MRCLLLLKIKSLGLGQLELIASLSWVETCRCGHANGAKFACDVLQNILEMEESNKFISIRILKKKLDFLTNKKRNYLKICKSMFNWGFVLFILLNYKKIFISAT
jgi:hypothetical protein